MKTSPYGQNVAVAIVDLKSLGADANYQRPGHGVAGSPLKPGCAENAIVGGFVGLSKTETSK